MSNDAGSGDRNAQRLLQSTCETTVVILTRVHLPEMHTITGNAQQKFECTHQRRTLRVSTVVKVAKRLKVPITFDKVCVLKVRRNNIFTSVTRSSFSLCAAETDSCCSLVVASIDIDEISEEGLIFHITFEIKQTFTNLRGCWPGLLYKTTAPQPALQHSWPPVPPPRTCRCPHNCRRPVTSGQRSSVRAQVGRAYDRQSSPHRRSTPTQWS